MSRSRSPGERRGGYDRSGYEDRGRSEDRDGYDDRGRSDYRGRNDDRGRYEDRRGDRRSGYDDRREGYDEGRRSGYDDRRQSGADDESRRSGYDRRGHMDPCDQRGYDDRRGSDRGGGGGNEARDDARSQALQQLIRRESHVSRTPADQSGYRSLEPAYGTGGRSGIGQAILPSIQPRSDATHGADVDASDGWKCPSCNNWNWGKRKTCNICNSSRSGLAAVKGTDSGTTRVGAAGGFKEVDDEEETRRLRREQEMRSERDQRKADKKKCDFCRRYSCIC